MRTGRVMQKRGFTLIETVVTIGIVAALAAVVYPVVVKQFDSADPAKTAEDLNNIRTAIETFGVNVRPQLPGDVEDLLFRPDGAAGVDRTSLRVAYTDAEAASWIGPYLSISVPTAIAQTDTAATTGFSGKIINRFNLFDIALATAGDTVPDASATSTADFLAVRLTQLSGAAFNAINLLIDGASEDDVTERRTLGKFRCPQATYPDNNAACVSAYFLASPTR
jgi:prepilin-type N-terminal cleavage/methylation domain-containing protein